jgi:hypothetical protein
MLKSREHKKCGLTIRVSIFFNKGTKPFKKDYKAKYIEKKDSQFVIHLAKI